MRILDSFHQENNPSLKVSYLSDEITRRIQLERPRLNHHAFMMLCSSDTSDLIVVGDLKGNTLSLSPL